MMHICVGKTTIIGSDNGLLPGRHQAIIWTNAGIWIIGPLGTNFSEIVIKILTYYSRKCVWKCLLENGGHLVSASMCYDRLGNYSRTKHNKSYFMRLTVNAPGLCSKLLIASLWLRSFSCLMTVLGVPFANRNVNPMPTEGVKEVHCQASQVSVVINQFGKHQDISSHIDLLYRITYFCGRSNYS